MEGMPARALAPLNTSGDMAINWKRFKRQFTTFLDAYHDKAADSKKVAILLHAAGEDAPEVFESFQLCEEDKKKLSVVFKKFDEYYVPATNTTYERHLLFNRRQEVGESYDHYMATLKNMSLNCQLGDLRDSLVKDVFISGVRDRCIQEKLLNLVEVDIQKALAVCRTHVTISSQVKRIKTEHEEEEQEKTIKQEPSIEVLQRNRRGTKKRSQINILEERQTEDEDEELRVQELQVSAIDDNKSGSDDWYIVSLLVKGQKIEFKCDSGAQVNVLSMKQYRKLKGLKTSERLGLIVREETLSEEVKTWIPKEYRELFDGQVGRIPQEVKIHIDHRVKPAVLPARRIPHALVPRVKLELDRLQNMGIIERITEPTEWVSQMVIVCKKDGSLRICLNPQPLNKAIKREYFVFPTIDEISAKLVGAKYFCKLDAQSGFWMLPLDKASSKLCTFQTAWGRYAFKRLPFGLNSAPEIFHRIIS
ncbi:uncharacterized protein LOC116852456 [Odontomachus brunneus]|uniref:uncharacterized protein LOC116852456 n=1 Tax=Odontomachus brunneus TaxID=486640 RepID=UPI0013F1E2E9|nr:uncharacterized protein LOC116852456 [Odontomachus brunneus]